MDTLAVLKSCSGSVSRALSFIMHGEVQVAELAVM